MAGDSPRQYRRPRSRTLVLTAIAFFSVIFLSYMRPNPIPAAFSRHPTPSKIEQLDIDDAMATTTTKHNKGGTERTYPQISALPPSLLPTAPSNPQDVSRRIIIIGDVHGHLKALEALLHKAEFSVSRGDTVIFAGDMVNKGPDSAGVVALAMRIGAFGVRGNHEDRVLRAWEYYESKHRKTGEYDQVGRANPNSNTDEEEEDEEEETESVLDVHENESVSNSEDPGEESHGTQDGSIEERSGGEEGDSQPQSHKKHKKKKGKKKGKKGKGKKPHRADLVTAKSLKPEHRDWLSALPLILRVGNLGSRYGEVLTVHAGLVPGIPLELQDPEAVMNMRTLLRPSHGHARNDGGEPSLADQTSPSRYDQVGVTYEGDSEREPMIPSPDRHGAPWAKIWTSYQTSHLSSRPHIPPTTVVYGHDAKAGLQLRKYAFGLDSGCARDDTLAGMIFEYAEAPHGEHKLEGGGEEWDVDVSTDEAQESQSRPRIRHRLVGVSCA
ncbi:hypothetical protein EKO27_g1607 [Xylaria grammica]|uniref:Calcineurin-like phosphoesterase domain-containing protein n=1 Tax=Xylaria grammica TaxID=363999 RepID=A0A439DGI2_9PEZI|nr:hypothetical protein EKO27_g1607 [Xylaria grammica]